MPKKVIELILGTQLIVVRTLLLLKNLPEANREQLKIAESELEKEILVYSMAKDLSMEFVKALIRKAGGG